jgi:hypothetical protein
MFRLEGSHSMAGSKSPRSKPGDDSQVRRILGCLCRAESHNRCRRFPPVNCKHSKSLANRLLEQSSQINWWRKLASGWRRSVSSFALSRNMRFVVLDRQYELMFRLEGSYSMASSAHKLRCVRGAVILKDV